MKDAAASLTETKDAKVKADRAVEEAKQKFLAASEALTAAKAKNALARTITLEDVLQSKVTADGFTYLNQYGEAYRKAATQASIAQAAYHTAQEEHAVKQQKADELNRKVRIRKAAEEAVRKAEEERKAEEARKAAEARRIAAQKADRVNAVRMPKVADADEAVHTAAQTKTAAAADAVGALRTDPVRTGDETPVLPYAGSAAMAALLTGMFLVRPRKKPDWK